MQKTPENSNYLTFLRKCLKCGVSLLGHFRLSNSNIRKHTVAVQLMRNKDKKMAQAKTLTERELRRVLDHIATRKHAARNRAMLLITCWAGLRVGEVAALRIADVVAQDGTIKPEIRLLPEQTKGRHARTVFVGERLRGELAVYCKTIKAKDVTRPLFMTQKRTAFSANTLCQHFLNLYGQVGLDGASSHSGRRTFITNLANKGIGVRVLMSLAGHRNISTTQAYIDVNDAMKRAAVELV
jgi:integrase/recombinase XerD